MAQQFEPNDIRVIYTFITLYFITNSLLIFQTNLSDEGKRDDVGAYFSLDEKDELDDDREDGVGHRDGQRVHQARSTERRLLERHVGNVRKPRLK